MEVASTSGVSTSAQVPDPKFIQYLFNPARIADCYLLVGNPSISPPEKIGVVHEMLSAHSEVLRSDLQSLNIKEKTPITIPDIMPRTFKILLRYVYGYDTTATLTFDDADNLLYVAEKYIMTELKDKVATRLIGLLNADNVCSLLNNPVCFQALALNAQINEILEMETKKVFQSPHFLELTDDAFVKILEKETLNIREIDIWHKAIEWAKHKAKGEDGDSLRKELVKPLKYIRLCTLQAEQFCQEVVTTKVLSDQEIGQICLSRGCKKKQPGLTKICNEIKVRKISYRRREKSFKPGSEEMCDQVSPRTVPTSLKRKLSPIFSKSLIIHGGHVESQYSSFVIETKSVPVVLEKIFLRSPNSEDWNLKVSCSVYLEQIGKPDSQVSEHFPSTSKGCLTISLPISSQSQDFTLSPHSRYKISASCDTLLPALTNLDILICEHFTIKPCLNEEGERCYFVDRIEYTVY